MSTGSGMVWSSTLASRLPGSPVAVKGEIVSEQPHSVSHRSEGESPLFTEMKSQFSDLHLLLEYKLLGEQQIPGVFMLPSEQTLQEWHGILFLHVGPWKGGVFRFSLLIPDGYPQTRPIVRFRGDVYHPYIHQKNGQLNMLRILPVWDPKRSHLYHIVSAIREAFIRHDIWETDDKEEERRLKEQIRISVQHSIRALNTPQEDTGPENLWTLLGSDDAVIEKARELIHSGGLPTEEVKTPGVFDQLSAQCGYRDT